MGKREGPLVTIRRSCFNCVYEACESETIEDGNDSDTSYRIRCTHPSVGARFIGGTWDTPEWCPYLATPTPGDRKP